MASQLILGVQDGGVTFGAKRIFDALTFNIHAGDKISLVGKNGTGKTTLMRVITDDLELDTGERWILQGTTIGYLKQEITPEPGQTVYDFVFEELKRKGRDEAESYKVEMVIQPLDLDPRDRMDRLSGGQLRRAALARALVEEPDILLLDEPTNHLDLDVIEWLERFIKSYAGAVVCISHDKAFLSAISDKVFWLDRGRIRVSPRGFAHFDDWSTQLLEQEDRELRNRQKLVDQEVEWASRGVKARRKRNQRRLEMMHAARAELKRDASAYRQMMRRIKIGEMDDPEPGAKMLAEFIKANKKFTDETGREKIMLEQFSMRIARGDRIGILGRNGSGKTTFLRMLLGEIAPDSGKVKRAKDIEYTYFDQNRRDLRPDDTVRGVMCPQGGDYVQVMGKPRHVIGYLKDFMFDVSMVEQRIKTLSGGQKNRLLLAKVLAAPQALLILDEPTNDLDMDTLDMLEEILAHYKGTLIVVSHDRDFLDQTVTKILAFEGDGVIEGYIGGYSDYLAARAKRHRDRAAEKAAADDAADKPAAVAGKPSSRKQPQAQPAATRTKKLTYKLQYELDNLPARIAALQAEIETLETMLSDATLYHRDRDAFDRATARIGAAREEMDAAETRWLELLDMQESPAESG